MSKSKLIRFIILLLLVGAGYWYITAKQPRVTVEPFTIVVLPDTQMYVWKHPGIFYEQIQWILDNKDKLNIKFVAHMGDIVQNYSQKPKEWEEASKNLALLEGVIPYSVIPGNHDLDHRLRDDGLTMYDTYFPASRYDQYPWYKGNRKENQNSYQTITIQTADGPLELLFLNLEVEPSDNTLTWARDIVVSHPRAYIILTTHKYLDDTGRLDNERQFSKEGNTGQQIWEKLVRDSCSIKMVLNGHYHEVDGEYISVSKNSCDQNVYQIIQDYQGREVGGNGRLRYYTFNPMDKTISARTYSPHTKTFENDSDSRFQIPFLY